MDRNFRIVLVDDSEFFRSLIETTFGSEFLFDPYSSGEDCLAALARLDGEAERPGLFLLDLDLPGIDGYELCRQIKAIEAFERVPTIFISGIDDIDARLEAFEAGAIDFLLKPVNVRELRQKIDAAHRLASERREYRARVLDSETLTTLILSNLDEYAVLIKFLRALNECTAPHGVGGRLLELLRAYGLDAAIQIRVAGSESTLSENGENCPLEVEILDHMRGMGRIFEFKNRAAYNFETVGIFVKNMPLDDPERCGRLRDHLAIAAEAADARLRAIVTHDNHVQARETVGALVDDLQRTVKEFESRYTAARFRGSSMTLDLHNELMSAFAFLGMTDAQESHILGIVERRANELAEIYDFSSQTQGALGALGERLASILKPVAAPQADPTSAAEAPPAAPTIELF